MIWAGIVACVSRLRLVARGPGALRVAAAAGRSTSLLPRSSRSAPSTGRSSAAWRSPSISASGRGAFHAAWSRLAEPEGRSRTSAKRAHRWHVHIEFSGLGAGSLGSPLGDHPSRGGHLDRRARAARGARHLARSTGCAPRSGAGARRALPAVVVLVAQAITNRVLTGEFSANGAIVKLTLFNPYMTLERSSTSISSFSST